MTLRCFSRPESPLKSWSTIWFLRSWLDRELDGGLARLYAELLRPPDGAEHRRRLEELLGRDAAPVQAGAADLVLFDDGYGQPGGGAVKGGRVPARAAADDDDVVLRRLSLARWQTDHLLVS